MESAVTEKLLKEGLVLAGLDKKTSTVELNEDAYAAFKETSEIVFKAGIRVPTSQLVQAMINAEMSG